MRILASNPDSIGDLVLRQPLYAALHHAGHEVALIVRDSIVPVTTAMVPWAQVLPLQSDPYVSELDWSALSDLVDSADAFDPDILLVASYQWTPLEEGLAERLPRTRKVGMTGKLFPGDPRSGLRNQSKMAFDVVVELSEDTPETRKNELLCSAVLQRTVQLPAPRLVPSEAQRRAGALVLPRFGLAPGGYWVACVGHHEYTRVRNWEAAKWAEALRYWARTYGRRFLLVGTESEASASEEIASAVERECPGAAVVAHGLDLDALLGVTDSSAGYIGRDTGPMHMAAACGKPVLAVFGGGTWPRFLPAAEPSRVLTVNVPCTGCDWICHLSESHCVKAVTVDRVRRAIDDMEHGRITGAEVDAADPDPVLTARMLREAGENYRKVLARAGVAEAAAARGAALAEKMAATERRAAASLQTSEDLRGRLYREESEAADLRLKLAQAGSERDVLEKALRQVERLAKHDLAAARKAAKAARAKAQRLADSRWHRLGRMLGLRLESTADGAAGSKPAAPEGPAGATPS